MMPRRPASVAAAVHARGVTLAALSRWLPGRFRVSGGTADVDIDPKRRGSSLRPLLASTARAFVR